MSRTKGPANTPWRRTQRKINGEWRDVDVRKQNGKEQVRVVKEEKKNPFAEGPLPKASEVKQGETFVRTRTSRKGRKNKITYVRTEVPSGFGVWKIQSSVWV
jgi:hypothetical protein